MDNVIAAQATRRRTGLCVLSVGTNPRIRWISVASDSPDFDGVFRYLSPRPDLAAPARRCAGNGQETARGAWPLRRASKGGGQAVKGGGSVERFYADVSKGHWAMIALQEDWSARDLLEPPRVAGGGFQFHVFVDHLIVQDHSLEPGVLDLLAACIETRSTKDHVEHLPVSRPPSGVDARGGAVVDVVVPRQHLGAG